jgi:formylglycine-generating enzyme required for sulfatase activity
MKNRVNRAFALIMVFILLTACAPAQASATATSLLTPTATLTLLPTSKITPFITPSLTPIATDTPIPTNTSTPKSSPTLTQTQIPDEVLLKLKTLPPSSVKIRQNLSQFTYHHYNKSQVGSTSAEETIHIMMIIEFSKEPLALHTSTTAWHGSWDTDEAPTETATKDDFYSEDDFWLDGRKYMKTSDSDRGWMLQYDEATADPILTNNDHGIFAFGGIYLNSLNSSEFIGIEKFNELDAARYRFNEKNPSSISARKFEGEYLVLISDYSLLSIKAELEGDHLNFPLMEEGKGKIEFTEELVMINKPMSILLPEQILQSVQPPEYVFVPDSAHHEESSKVGDFYCKYVFTQDLGFDELVEFYKSELPKQGWSIDNTEISDRYIMYYISKDNHSAKLSIERNGELLGSEHPLITWIIPNVTSTQPPPGGKKTPEPSSMPEFITDTQGIKMALIPAGEFQMGSWDVGDVSPVHTVYLDSFYIDIYEVTNGFYTACVKAGACKKPDPTRSSTRQNYYVMVKYEDYPVINIGWKEAREYCQWRKGDLPTEAQWEKAARGGLEGKTYPWGDEEPTCQPGATNGAHFEYCDPNDTIKVGSFRTNGYGLFDMAGNISEFVLDWFGPYNGSRVENPVGPATGEVYVIRGGGWNWNKDLLSVAYRNIWSPTYILGLGDDFTGFRCALSP